jgi:hypothetical protein
MTESVENVILEHLRHIRGRVESIAEDLGDVKLRTTSLESSMVLVKREVTGADDTSARQQVSLDKLAARIDRIERRLELAGS